ncbi:MAG: hypothetical protein HY550_03605 [Elusimicrobia bacterium]|nr:hypothetical protein [Elusimicrobiota bacterium]
MPIKKLIKWGALVFAVSGAGFIAFSFFLSAKKKDCLEGEGRKAAAACTFLIENHTAGYKGAYLLRRAQLLEKDESWDGVVSDLNELLAIKVAGQVSPEQVLAAYESLAAVHARKGAAAEALKFAELAAQNGSKNPGIYLSLAGAFLQEKKFSEALGLLETAGGLEGAKKHPYYNALASAYEGLDDFPKAYGALKAGLGVRAPRPVLAATSKHMGLVCYELKRYKEAELYLGYTLKAGLDCPECVLLQTTIRLALQEDELPDPRPEKKRK